MELPVNQIWVIVGDKNFRLKFDVTMTAGTVCDAMRTRFGLQHGGLEEVGGLGLLDNTHLQGGTVYEFTDSSPQVPAAQVASSVTDQRIICLLYGKLRREGSMAQHEINVESLSLLTREKYPEFTVKSFNLYYRPDDGAVSQSPTKGKKSIVTDDHIASYIDSTDHAAALTFYIENDCKCFSDFTIPEALKYAGAKGDEPITDDTKFPSSDFDEQDMLVGKILEHAVADIMCKIPIFGPIESAQNEASVRELIDPVLVAAARISGAIRIVSKKQITGSKGNGPVDYDMMYKDFNIVITEAKKDNVQGDLGQNIAQIVSGREDYLQRKQTFIWNKKRSFSEYQTLIADIPSYGILSNAEKWIFIRYSRSEGLTCPVVYRSTAFVIPLGFTATEVVVKKAMMDVIRILVGVLSTQKSAVDSNAFVHSQDKYRSQDEKYFNF